MDEFKKGSHWVYGGHGLGIVLGGYRHKHVELVFGGVKITLSHEAALVRLRAPMNEDEAAALLEVLQAPSEKQIRSWVSRAKAYKERLSLGIPDEVATVYRDLGRKPVITWGELGFFRKATGLLVPELELVWGSSASKRIREAAGVIR